MYYVLSCRIARSRNHGRCSFDVFKDTGRASIYKTCVKSLIASLSKGTWSQIFLISTTMSVVYPITFSRFKYTVRRFPEASKSMGVLKQLSCMAFPIVYAGSTGNLLLTFSCDEKFCARFSSQPKTSQRYSRDHQRVQRCYSRGPHLQLHIRD